MTNAEAHRIAREEGPSGPLYLLARVLLTLLFRVWLRLRATGADRIPRGHGAIVAPNHKGELDPFLIAACSGRRLQFMAKAELFDGWLARPLVRLGAFPLGAERRVNRP